MLKRDIKVDWRFIEVYYEINSLGTFLDIMEEQLKHLTDQEKVKAFANVDWQDETDVAIAYQAMYERIDNILPRYFRNPLIIPLWAMFESVAIDIAEYIRTKNNIDKEFKEINKCSDNILKALQTYYTQYLKVPLFKPTSMNTHINIVRVIRNAIAHWGGRLEIMPTDVRKTINKWIELDIGINVYLDNLVLSEHFLQEAYLIVKKSLSELIERVRNKYPHGADVFPVPKGLPRRAGKMPLSGQETIKQNGSFCLMVEIQD